MEIKDLRVEYRSRAHRAGDQGGGERVKSDRATRARCSVFWGRTARAKPRP